MALLVWLPLRGDLKNLGLSNITVTNSGATVAENGKIGLCYSFNGSSSRISCSSITLTYPISICGWFNCTSYTSATQYWISYNTDSGGTVGHSIGIGMYTSLLSIWYAGLVVSLRAITTGLWYHIAVTINNSKECKTYLNGELIDTRTFSSNQPASKWITIGARSSSTTGGVGGAAYFFNGKANDIRIYDHCLSPKEIKEISKGLVLHYKLDDMMRSNENLLPTASLRMSETGQTSTNEYMNLCSCINIWDNYGLVPYTISFEIKAAVAHSFNIYGDYGSKPKYGFSRKSINVTTEWQRFSHTFTPYLNDDSGTWAGISVYGIYGSGAIVSVRKVKLELGTIETPLFIDDKIVYDSSGYKNNGIISGTLSIDNDSPRYNYSILFSSGAKITPSIFPSFLTDECTVSMWVKLDQLPSSSPGRTMLYTAWYGFSCEITSNGSTYFRTYLTNGLKDSPSGTLTINNWIHWVGIKSSTGVSLYLNGTLIGTSLTTDNFNWKSVSSNSVALYNNNYYLYGKLSDLKLYTTALSAKDIKELYDTSAIVDNLGNTYGYLFEESGEENLLFNQNLGIINKLWVSGLSKFTQTSCQCTLTDDGYRIYRTPNIDYVNSSPKVMYGGFLINNANNILNLKDNHSYILAFDIKGQSSNAASNTKWTNNYGWGGGGLIPTITETVMNNPVTTNFYSPDDWCHFSMFFTTNDGVYKVCTTSYSSYVLGETYLSYALFAFGFTYMSTGELGTDLYIKNLSLLDVTNDTNINISKNGIINSESFIEVGDTVKLFKDKLIQSNQLIEI